MSNLENLSDDQLGNLIKLSRHLFSKRASDVVYTSLIDIMENEQLDLLDEIGKYFGVKNMGLDDYTFIVELNSLNEDYVKGDSIIRPTLANYEIFEYEFEWQKGVGIGRRSDEIKLDHAVKISKWRDRKGKKIFVLE
jgi:hypothetical protein